MVKVKKCFANKAVLHYAVYFADGKFLETSNAETAKLLGVFDENRNKTNDISLL